MKIHLVFVLLLLCQPGTSQRKPKTPSQGCEVLRNYQDHARSEIRGMKEGEIAEPCAAPKKVPAKKKPPASHTPATQRAWSQVATPRTVKHPIARVFRP